MSETDSFRRNGEAEFYWLSETFYLGRLLLRRLHALKKHLSQRAISSVQTNTNGEFFDVVLSMKRLYANRLSQRSGLFFWGLRHNRFISELTGGAVLSLWRRAQLAAKYDPETLSIWSQDRSEQSWPLLCAVIEQVSNCPQTLSKFARHSSTAVRMSVADNLYTDLATMFALSSDDDLDVRYSIAESHNAPIAVLQKLTGDINPYIAERAQRTLTRLMSGGDVRSRQFGKHPGDLKRRVIS